LGRKNACKSLRGGEGGGLKNAAQKKKRHDPVPAPPHNERWEIKRGRGLRTVNPPFFEGVGAGGGRGKKKTEK